MHLSPSEFFILGRIMAAWQTAAAMPQPPHWAASLMETVNHVFYEFGLEHVAAPGTWREVDRREPPDDTVWKRIEGHAPDPRPLGHVDGLIPGLPALALGVSPGVPGRLFVERTDGDICGWIIGRPKSGLSLVIMRWLTPWAGVSPQLWLAMRDGTWPAVVEEWRTLPEFVRIEPHQAFTDDRPAGVVEAAERAALEAGCEQAFRLGGWSAEVEARLWKLADASRLFDAFRRHENETLGDPDEKLAEVLVEAVAVVRSDTVDRLCRADDGTIGFYDSARRILDLGKGPLGGAAVISDAIGRAHGRAVQASSYLYGTFRARDVA